jgi:uncharacterized Zn-finger protein
MIPFFKNEKIKNVSCGYCHTIVTTGNRIFFNEIESGVYSFGHNEEGQLGLGNTTDQSTPQIIPFFKNEKIKNVSCGYCHTIITTGN